MNEGASAAGREKSTIYERGGALPSCQVDILGAFSILAALAALRRVLAGQADTAGCEKIGGGRSEAGSGARGAQPGRPEGRMAKAKSTQGPNCEETD